jgi:hypothetical protein
MSDDSVRLTDETSVVNRPSRCCATRRQRVAWGIVTAVALFVVVAIVAWRLTVPASSTPAGLFALPLIKPPVAASAPASLTAGSAGLTPASAHGPSLASLDASTVHDRFFNEAGGPANLFVILQAVDDRINDINSRSAQFPCMNATAPRNYTIRQWVGDNVTFQAQCGETIGDAGFDLFAVARNGTLAYIYTMIGDSTVAAIATRTGNVTSRVDVWYAVGVENRNGSHGVARITARPLDGVFEMAVRARGSGSAGRRSAAPTTRSTSSAARTEATRARPRTRCASTPTTPRA